MDEEKLILIVDDDENTRKLMEFALVREGFVVCAATTGKEALVYLERTSPVLIIIDMVMPDMDGYTLLNRIRTDPAVKDLPVIVSSGKAGMKEFFDLEDKSRRPDAFIAKPYRIKDLIDTVRRVL